MISAYSKAAADRAVVRSYQRIPSKSWSRRPWKKHRRENTEESLRGQVLILADFDWKIVVIWSIWATVVLKGSIIQLVHYKFIEPPLVLLQIPATTKTVRGNQIHGYKFHSQAVLTGRQISPPRASWYWSPVGLSFWKMLLSEVYVAADLYRWF